MWNWFNGIYNGNQSFFFLLGVVFIPLSVFFIKKAFNKKEGVFMGYWIHSFSLIKIDESLKNGLKIIYKDKPIESIKRSYIRIYNDGTKDLRREDFYGNNLTIFSSDEIIEAEIINQRYEQGNFNLLRKKESEYILDFDYFSPKQVIDLIILQKGDNLSLNCNAAGVYNLFKVKQSDLSLSIVLLCLGTILSFSILFKVFTSFDTNWYWWMLRCFLLLASGMYIFWGTKGLLNKIKAPKYLTSFKDFYKKTDDTFFNKLNIDDITKL